MESRDLELTPEGDFAPEGLVQPGEFFDVDEEDGADPSPVGENGKKKGRKGLVSPSTATVYRESGCRNQTGFIGVRQRKWGMFAAEIRDGDKRR